MLIAEILPNFSYEVIGREKEMIRLGDSTFATRYLSEELIELGMETIKKFIHLAKTKGVHKYLAVATSAIREAHNGGDFLKKIKKETGIIVRLISGDEEGKLIYQGVKHSIQLATGNTLIVDIGGGSVEIMVVNQEEILFLQSFKLGVARLKNLFLKKESPKKYAKLERHIEKQLKEAVPSILDLGFTEAIGTSGTLNNIATLACYANKDSVGTVTRDRGFTYEDAQALYEQLQDSTPDTRMEMKGLDPQRNDLILSGAAITYVVMKLLKVKEFKVLDKAIREGIIYQYIQKNRKKIRSEAEIPDVRRRNVLKLADKCDYDREHAEQVARLSLQIFDRTQVIHQLSSLDRELLEYSALLHDIGYYISYEKHHRHAYYLIKNVSMNGFSEAETDIMALVARYHRRSLPKKSHPWFNNLPKGARRRVQWLAAILKIADALDRSHFSVVEGIKIRNYSDKIIIQVEASDDSEYEIWEAKQKCELLQKLVKREVVFKLKTIQAKSLKSRNKISKVTKIRAI